MPSAAVASAAVASVPGEGLSSSALGSAGQEPRGWAGDTGPWGRERSALMSHAEARGAGNGNFWAALFIRRSRYDPSSRLPHCPEGNSSPSWCQRGWGVTRAVPSAGWQRWRVTPSSRAGASGGLSSGGRCPPCPETPLRGAAHLRSVRGAALPGCPTAARCPGER